MLESNESAFSNDDFDASTWINKALEERQEDDGFEGYLASLAMRLHLLSQDYTDQLEAGMMDATQTIPRVQNDITRIEDVLKAVSGEMQELATQLQDFDQRNVAGVEELSRLDMLRKNMEKCKSTLEEHARWSQVVREAKTFLEGGGRLADSADRIEIMLKSLELLKLMPGHGERESTFTALRDSLLTAVRPRVSAAVAADSVDVPGLLEYFYVYHKLGKQSELQGEYVSARSAQRGMTDLWASYDAAAGDLAGFYVSFLQRLISFLSKERKNLVVLFSEKNFSGGEKDRNSSVAADKGALALFCDLLSGVLTLTVKEGLAKKLESNTSPSNVATICTASAAFVTVMVAQLEADNSAGDLTEVVPLVMQALFDPLSNQLEAMHAPEGPILRTSLTDAVTKVSFTSGGDEGSVPFENAAGLGLEVRDIGDEQGDPLQSCMAFSETFLLAADACVDPVCDSLRRSARVLGGLFVKQHMKMVGTSLGAYVKKMCVRSEDLRRACGLSASSSTSSSSGAPARTPGGGNPPSSSGSQPTATDLTESWARKLEAQQLVASNYKGLLPSILRSLQTTGRLLRNLDKIDRCVSEVCSAVGANLAMLSSADQLTDMTLEACRASLARATELGCSDSEDERLDFLARANEGGGGEGDLGSLYASYMTLQSSTFGELRHMLRNTGDLTFSLSTFSAVSTATSCMKVASGCLFFDAATALPSRLLSDYAAEGAWVQGLAEDGAADRPGVWGELAIDDNLLPQSTLTQCGEHLLSLVQDLELFSSSDALSDLRALHGTAEAALPTCNAWGEDFKGALSDVAEGNVGILEQGLQQLCKRASCASCVSVCEKVLFGSYLTDLGAYDKEEDISMQAAIKPTAVEYSTADDDTAALNFVNDWLGTLGDALVGLILSKVVRIKKLSKLGRAQLAVDLDYFTNVIRAVGLSVHPLLLHVRSLLNSPEQPSALLSSLREAPSIKPAAVALRAVDVALVKAMGEGQ